MATAVSISPSMREIMRIPIDVSMSTHAKIDWLPNFWNRLIRPHATRNMIAQTICMTTLPDVGLPFMRSDNWKKPSAEMSSAKMICRR